MFKTTVFLLCCLLLSSAVKAEAKIAKAKPYQAEQNLKLYQKSMETTELDIDNEGSGEDDYDEYDDDYYYDDDDDDEYSSGDSQWLPHEDSAEIQAELIPDKESDFHFKEDIETDKNVIDDLLYEYNNEYYYEDDDDYLDQVEQDLEGSENQEVIVTKQAEQDLTGKVIFQPSYIFLMLTSALISFAIFILAFILCRRSAQRHHKKTNMVPFIVSSTANFSSSSSSKQHYHSSPIVKNYQRVPTSTKELMQPHSSVVDMMNQNQSERPLLT